MKTRGHFAAVWALAMAVAGGALAQSPRERFRQMVEQLQKSPNDNALRERIIQGASPAEAREDMQRWRCVKI